MLRVLSLALTAEPNHGAHLLSSSPPVPVVREAFARSQ
jgi:hypothetical protein